MQIWNRGSRNRGRHAERDGFTLIELLVVIAIISLLGAILFPVFGRARENARRANCQSNLKQIGIGMLQYMQDFDERLPICFDNRALFSWDRGIQPYMGVAVESGGSPTVFRCPSDSRSTTGGKPTRTYSMPYRGNNTDGSGRSVITYIAFTTPTSYNIMLGAQLSRITAPAGTLLVLERPSVGNFFGGTSGAYTSCASGSTSCQDIETPGVPIHMETWNYLFCDGHVKSLRPEKTIGTGTMATPNGMWTLADND